MYLKYFNDEGFIGLFSSVPEKISKTVEVINLINQISYEEKPAESGYYNAMKSSILSFNSSLHTLEDSIISNIPDIDIEFIKSQFAIHIHSIRNDTIEFDKFQSFAQFIMGIIKEFGSY